MVTTGPNSLPSIALRQAPVEPQQATPQPGPISKELQNNLLVGALIVFLCFCFCFCGLGCYVAYNHSQNDVRRRRGYWQYGWGGEKVWKAEHAVGCQCPACIQMIQIPQVMEKMVEKETVQPTETMSQVVRRTLLGQAPKAEPTEETSKKVIKSSSDKTSVKKIQPNRRKKDKTTESESTSTSIKHKKAGESEKKLKIMEESRRKLKTMEESRRKLKTMEEENRKKLKLMEEERKKLRNAVVGSIKKTHES